MSSRLPSELDRLYGSNVADHLRAVVLELARPADWNALAKVWRGVQADLDLPAPAIAVSGVDAYQLWFSLAEPVAAAQARTFVDGLQARYLADIARPRVRMVPAAELALPPLQLPGDRWSAFIAPDLAPVFAEEPWLDTPPSPDGQADVLSRLASIKGADFRAALEQLGAAVATPSASAPASAPASADDVEATSSPKRFLLKVMNDETVALGLRIDAAKALLPWFEGPPRA